MLLEYKPFFNKIVFRLKQFFQAIKQWLSQLFPKRSSPKPPPLDLDARGFTPLMRAVENNEVETVKQLLNQGYAHINYYHPAPIPPEKFKNFKLIPWKSHPDTALALAIKNLNIDIIKLLLDHNASTQFTMADTYYYEAKALRPQGNVLYSNFSDSDALLHFIPESYLREKNLTPQSLQHLGKIIELLTSCDRPIIIKPDSQFFKIALRTNNKNAIKRTLKLFSHIYNKGSNPLEPNLYKLGYYEGNPFLFGRYHSIEHTPITYALEHNLTDMALLLLEEMAHYRNPTEYEQLLYMSLIHAVHFNNLTVLEFCLTKVSGEKLNGFQSDSGLTALQTAAYKGNLEIIKKLCECKQIDTNYTHEMGTIGQYNTTALYYGIISKCDQKTKENIILFLLNHGTRFDQYSLKASVENNFYFNSESVTQIIEYINEHECRKPSYQPIRDKIQEHNKNMQKETAKIILNAFPKNTPTVLASLVCDYLPFKAELENPGRTALALLSLKKVRAAKLD